MFEHAIRFALAAAMIGAAALALPVAGQASRPIEATTPAGDKILLYPDGRWEYADPAKRAATPAPPAAQPATVAQPATAAQPSASPAVASSPAGACPPGAQGHLFWVGRCVLPGDPDYNRGSLSGKGR